MPRKYYFTIAEICYSFTSKIELKIFHCGTDRIQERD